MKIKFKIGELNLKVDENEVRMNDLECETEMTSLETKEYIEQCMNVVAGFTNTDIDLSSYSKKVKKEFELNERMNNQYKGTEIY